MALNSQAQLCDRYYLHVPSRRLRGEPRWHPVHAHIFNYLRPIPSGHFLPVQPLRQSEIMPHWYSWDWHAVSFHEVNYRRRVSDGLNVYKKYDLQVISRIHRIAEKYWQVSWFPSRGIFLEYAREKNHFSNPYYTDPNFVEDRWMDKKALLLEKCNFLHFSVSNTGIQIALQQPNNREDKLAWQRWKCVEGFFGHIKQVDTVGMLLFIVK